MLAAAADAGAADGSAAFASAGEATKQIEAKESVSPSNLFISISFPKKIRPALRAAFGTPGGRVRPNR